MLRCPERFKAALFECTAISERDIEYSVNHMVVPKCIVIFPELTDETLMEVGGRFARFPAHWFARSTRIAMEPGRSKIETSPVTLPRMIMPG